MIELNNQYLRVLISETGGKMQSIYGKKTDTEYLWQGDPAYWKGTAPNLFPFIGRLFGKRYLLNGKSYDMKIHGFLSSQPMQVLAQEPDSVVLVAEDTEQTMAVYPYRFRLQLSYRLVEKTLHIAFSIQNGSKCTLHFGIGGHPGFRVPMEDGLNFSDYSLSFDTACEPKLIEFSKDVLCTGVRTPYPLQQGRMLPLKHDLFNQDAIVLADAPRKVTLSSTKGSRGVCVSYPQMPYIGFWHTPNTDAPFLCIEPWSMLPGREGVTEELSSMADVCSVDPGGQAENNWSICVF